MPGFPTHTWRKRVCALPIQPAHKVVLIRLAEYADYESGRDAWPGRTMLARQCGVSESAVDRALKAGVRCRVVTRASRGSPGRNAVYHLTLGPGDE